MHFPNNIIESIWYDDFDGLKNDVWQIQLNKCKNNRYNCYTNKDTHSRYKIDKQIKY